MRSRPKERRSGNGNRRIQKSGDKVSASAQKKAHLTDEGRGGYDFSFSDAGHRERRLFTVEGRALREAARRGRDREDHHRRGAAASGSAGSATTGTTAH